MSLRLFFGMTPSLIIWGHSRRGFFAKNPYVSRLQAQPPKCDMAAVFKRVEKGVFFCATCVYKKRWY